MSLRITVLSLVSGLLLAVAASAGTPAPGYDLLIKNATVLDSKNNFHEIRDVAIRNNKIAAVEKNIPASDAAKTINAEGLFLTPGLVDIHTHVYAGTGAEIEIIARYENATTGWTGGRDRRQTHSSVCR